MNKELKDLKKQNRGRFIWKVYQLVPPCRSSVSRISRQKLHHRGKPVVIAMTILDPLILSEV